MATHDIKKDVKIIDEIMTYFLKHGFHDLSISIHREKEFSTLTFELPLCNKSQKLCEKMKEEINPHKEEELEEYYWQLLGESDNTGYELSIIGTIIDSIWFENCQDTFRLKLSRKH